MTIKNIRQIRLSNQQISQTNFTSPAEIVSAMGAMQAQDFNSVKWAIGTRLPDLTQKSIEAAFNKGEIVRTHLLRPTWHIVAAENIYWMLELTAPHILPLLKSRNNNLELTPAIFSKSYKIMARILTGGKHLTREEIITELQKGKISTSGVHAAHIFLQAELEGLICSGSIKNNKLTYALLEERVPKKIQLSKVEALAKLALIYFTSHGPATVLDFSWWSGLTLTNAKHAVEMNRTNLISEKIDSLTYWFAASTIIIRKKESVHLLPAYDEFLISYRNRSSCIPSGIEKTIISNNGIFRPVILINGQVSGLWRTVKHKNTIAIEANLFQPPNDKIKKSLEDASLKYSHFLNQQTELVYG